MRYVLKKLRRMRVFDLGTGRLKAMMSDLKTGQFTGSQETVYAEGTDGAKLAAFDINKVAGFNATNGTIEMGYLAMQVGGEVVEVQNGSDITLHVVLKTDDGATALMPHKAVGVAGKEIGFIYPIGRDGMPVYNSAYEQNASATATEFAYDPATGEITLPTGVFKAGDEISVHYKPQFAKYNELTNASDKFAETGRVVIDAWFTDVCTNMDTPLQVVLPKGKISGEIDISFGDQAAVQNIAVEAMTAVCDTDAALWKLYDYNEQEIVA